MNPYSDHFDEKPWWIPKTVKEVLIIQINVMNMLIIENYLAYIG